MTRKRTIVLVAVFMATTLLPYATGRASYVLEAEYNEFVLLDTLFRQETGKVNRSAPVRPKLSVDPAPGKGPEGFLQHVVARIVGVDRGYRERVVSYGAADTYREFRHGQTAFKASREKPTAIEIVRILGSRKTFQRMVGLPHVTDPEGREEARVIFLETIEEEDATDAMKAQAWNYVCVILTDRILDEVKLFDVVESYEGAVEACREATRLDAKSPIYKRNLELLLSVRGTVGQILQEGEQEPTDGDPDDQPNEGTPPDGDPPEDGTTGF